MRVRVCDVGMQVLTLAGKSGTRAGRSGGVLLMSAA